MIKVSYDKGNIKLTVGGPVIYITAEMKCIIKSVYNVLKGRNEKDAEFFKEFMLHDLENGGPFKTTNQLKEDVASLMDEPDEEN